MNRLITRCPNCQESLKITSLKCPDCGLELRNSFELSKFDQISDEQYSFLITFLKSRGNLKSVQNELQISYANAKRQLDELLLSLGITEVHENVSNPEGIDISEISINPNSTRASEIIKAKLKKAGGRVVVHTARGLPCVVTCDDNDRFKCDKLPNQLPFSYDVFDIVVDLLRSNGGRARKGNGRSYRVGDPECDETTVVGIIAKKYFKKRPGESVYDPVFVISAILEWAGIVSNERGELVLTATYMSSL